MLLKTRREAWLKSANRNNNSILLATKSRDLGGLNRLRKIILIYPFNLTKSLDFVAKNYLKDNLIIKIISATINNSRLSRLIPCMYFTNLVLGLSGSGL